MSSARRVRVPANFDRMTEANIQLNIPQKELATVMLSKNEPRPVFRALTLQT